MIEACSLVQQHLRDRVRLVSISPREHEMGTCPLSHTSLVTPVACEHSLLDQMAARSAAISLEASLRSPALVRLAEQLPADQATA